MEALIQLIIYIVIFAIVAYGLHWVCVTYALPQPVLWICGAVLLIILLMFLARMVGIGGGVHLFPR